MESTTVLSTAPNSPPAPVTPVRLVRPRAERPFGLLDLTLPALTERLATLGQPAYRAKQVFQAVYQQLVTGYDQMTTLPAALRAELAATLPLTTLEHVRDHTADADQTIKTLYRTGDGELVETVLMLYPDRATVCVSCQVGCAVGCAFCATGLGGLARNLSAGEIVAQVVGAARQARDRGRPLTNIVMMGMGEPFQNYPATMAFIGIVNDSAGMNFGARRITVSTSGVVPKIDALADEPYQVNLAVSLHAPTDALRGQLVPINRRYPISELMAACDRYVAKTHRRISFEYALMRGINDGDDVAHDLAALLAARPYGCHVNLIPLNPVEVLPYERPDPAGIERFADILRAAGVPTTVRYSRGVEIAAACGQLRAKAQQVAS